MYFIAADRKTEPVFLQTLPTFVAGANKVISMEVFSKIWRMDVHDKMSMAS
jgi:hypothetical protein